MTPWTWAPKVVRVDAPDVVDGLVDVAGTHRATHLVLPHREESGIARLRRRPLADRLNPTPPGPA